MIEFHALALSQTVSASDAMLLGGGREKLAGAVARPAQSAYYGNADLAQQAALLAHGIVEAHAFRDGNKRAAYTTLRVFLQDNGYDIDAPKVVRTDWPVRLALGASVEEVAASIRQHLVRL